MKFSPPRFKEIMALFAAEKREGITNLQDYTAREKRKLVVKIALWCFLIIGSGVFGWWLREWTFWRRIEDYRAVCGGVYPTVTIDRDNWNKWFVYRCQKEGK